MNIVQWIGAHFGSVVASSSLLTGFVLAKIHSALPGLVEKEESLFLYSGLAKLTLPEDKAAAKAVLVAIRVRFPEAGASVFTQAADACIKEVPALTPYRADLISLFSSIEQAAAAGIDAETKP